MACSTVKNLGAALSALVMCAPTPLQRNWTLVDKVSTDRAAPGKVVYVDFQSIPVQDSLGRHAHIRSVEIRAAVAYTAGANNDAVSPWNIRGIINSIYLTDISGHEYLSALDGRSILDDSFFRGGAFRLPFKTTPGITQDIGAGARTVDASLRIDLVGVGPGSNDTEGLIPVAALQQRGAQAMRFRLESAFPSAPAGVTVNSFVTHTSGDGDPGIEVWADIVYLADPIVDAPWCLREYTKTDMSGTLQAPEARHEYLVIRPWQEDTGGMDSIVDYDGFSVSVAAFPVMQGATARDAVQRTLDFELSEPRSARAMGLETDLMLYVDETVTELFRGYLTLLPPRAREYAPAGPVSFRYNTRGSATFTRYLHRYTLCDSGERVQRIKAAALGGGECGVMQVVGGMAVEGIADPTAPKVLTKLV